MSYEEYIELLRSANALERIADALEQMSGDGKPYAPDYKRHLSEYPGFDWSSIQAEIAGADEYGPTALVWRGNTFTRRSSPGDKKYGPSVWYSRGLGGSEYLTLVTFKEYSEAEPLPQNIRHLKQQEPAHNPQAPKAPTPAEPPAEPAPSALKQRAEKAASSTAPVIRSSTEVQAWFIGETGKLAQKNYKMTPQKRALLPALMEGLFTLEGDVIGKSKKVLRVLTGYSDYNQCPEHSLIALWKWLDVADKGTPAPSARAKAEAHLILDDALDTEAAVAEGV